MVQGWGEARKGKQEDEEEAAFGVSAEGVVHTAPRCTLEEEEKDTHAWRAALLDPSIKWRRPLQLPGKSLCNQGGRGCRPEDLTMQQHDSVGVDTTWLI